MILRITDWDKHFENNRTRTLRELDWVPIPNKMHGDGYTELLDHPNGAAHFGAWVALVEIASRTVVRGALLREPKPGREPEPHTSASLSRMSRIPAAIFDEAIPRLLSIGWIEEVQSNHNDGTFAHPGAGSTSRSRTEVPDADEPSVTIPHPGAGLASQSRTAVPESAPQVTTRAENGTEQNGIEKKRIPAPNARSARSARETKPTVTPSPAPLEIIASLCEQYFDGARGRPDAPIVAKIAEGLGGTEEPKLIAFRNYLERKQDAHFVPKGWGIFPLWAEEVGRNV